MIAQHSTTDTHLGPFTAVVDADGAVLASGWTPEVGELLPLMAASLRPSETRKALDLGAVSKAVERYHAGELDAVDEIPVRQSSGPFREGAWATLRTLPAGAPVTYRECAALAGSPEAARAAAAACANNAAALFVPCHRVLRGDGALGGFRWGTDLKAQLLEHERN
ncbi:MULTISPECIES: methylated-DNA--[protein]-cysteine S-methyltransferase [unclassified Actinopolyspora]|uniref:methylated-DNA--[protein]-cysteine S-methyltransferase n=1 Tax=unclassified Actinopolyspora TaxID=2639451 RepID=UPI0013F65D33|nr:MULTISPECIES: methylated-DNA--[protein]-cysteine S-methyltransferase [unclassified Actinopolyspora]NHD17885.1 methylated-DNA--[protein]-cysteine S-methyltransferase [Actinopolyspora sp. BKK2]NHE77758.1 methylated-DNA--[protein]-cysteine S-methyltransferase [Actinopolyspora sp. BKK1]